jgi:hypothetical protein
MSKLLEDFHDDPVQHAHCIRLFKIYLDTLKGKSEEGADKASGATAAAKNSSGTKEEPQGNDKEYIDSGHNSVGEDEESDVETEDDVDRDIPEFLEQSKEGEAVEEDKVKDGGEAEAEDGREAEAEDGREAAAEEEAGGSDGAEDTTMVSKAKKKGLLPIKFNLSETVDIACITEARDEFFAEVHLLKFDALTNNKKTVMKVTEDDAIKITNFFFGQIMGKPALNRLSSLVQSYNKHDDGEPDKGVTERAQEAARRTINRTLKHFFETVGKSEASSRGSNSIIHQIYIIRMHMELTEAYIELIKEATFTSGATKEEKAKKNALKTELRLKGCPTAKGKGLKSAMIQYICRELVMEKNALDHRTQCGKSVKCLVDQVGPGIIPVLPEGGMNV